MNDDQIFFKLPDIVKVCLEPCGTVPRKATTGSAGYDLSSAERVTIEPGKCAMISTGVRVALPCGSVGLIFERSSLHRHGLSLANKVGVIDSDYRGVISLLLENISDESVDISVGDRLAQMIVMPVKQTVMREVTSLDETKRGDGGFGSTGTSSLENSET